MVLSGISVQYGYGRDAMNAAIRKHTDVFDGYETDLGILTERWFALHTDSLSARTGTGHHDSPDVLLLIDGTVVAVNVKRTSRRRTAGTTQRPRRTSGNTQCWL